MPAYNEPHYGKISSVQFGRVTGRDDTSFGIEMTLESEGWAVGVSRVIYDKADVAWLNNLLMVAKKREVKDLVGTPIVCTFQGPGSSPLAGWRVLTEVLL